MKKGINRTKYLRTMPSIQQLQKRGRYISTFLFNEPLYELMDLFDTKIECFSTETQSPLEDITLFKEIWNTATKKLVLVGVNYPNSLDQKYLELLAIDDSVVVFTETTSNIHHETFFPSIDKIIAPLTEEEFEKLQPEVLLTLGGMIISKKVKAFLRKFKPKHHWHVDQKESF